MATGNRLFSYYIIQLIKRFYPLSKVVVGGVHATLFSDLLINRLPVDAIFKGESEFSFADYVLSGGSRSQAKGLAGITIKDGEKVVSNDCEFVEDIDSIPQPAFHHVPWERYRSRFNEWNCHMVTSRGCPFFCRFCSIPALHNGRYRLHSVERVIADIELLRHYRRNVRIMFHDDYFRVSSERTQALCRKIIRKNMGIRWTTRSRVDSVDLESLQLMKKSGCEKIFYGVESGSPVILRKMNKEFNPDAVKRAFLLTQKAGIEAVANIIVGFPGEDRHASQETKRLLREIKPDKVYFSPAILLPGTALYHQYKAEGAISDEYWFQARSAIPCCRKKTECLLSLRDVYGIRLSLEKGSVKRLIFIAWAFVHGLKSTMRNIGLFLRILYDVYEYRSVRRMMSVGKKAS